MQEAYSVAYWVGMLPLVMLALLFLCTQSNDRWCIIVSMVWIAIYVAGLAVLS